MKNLLPLILLLSITSLFAQEKKVTEIFTVVEETPRFPGCEDLTDRRARKNCADDKRLDFIEKNLEYPEEAIKNKVEGVVVIKFYIDKDGSLKEAKILKDIGAGCGQAALKLVNKMNQMRETWIPGKQRGKNVNVYFNMPIRFKLPKTPPPPPVEELPRFPGCEGEKDIVIRKTCSDKKLLDFIDTNVKYPKKAIKYGVEGIVVVRFYVDIDGKLNDIHVIKDIGAGCGIEAVKVLKKMNKKKKRWIPGKLDGVKTKVYFNLPIEFKLS